MPAVNPKPQQQSPNSGNPQKASVKNNSKTIIIVVSLFIVCIVASYFLFPVIRDSLNKKPTEIIVQEEIIPEKPIESDVNIEEIIPVKQESSLSVEKGFYIIVGSFHQKHNAENLVKKLSNEINLTTLFFEELGLYRVSAGKFDTIHKAYNHIFSVKNIDGCEEAWVLENI